MPGEMHPRRHNALSYLAAAAVLPIALFAFGGAEVKASWIASGLWVLHFLRRGGEALWVHRYSGRPVLPSDYLVEYAYYWGFAVWVAWGLARAPATYLLSPNLIVGVPIFFAGELGNAWSHRVLRALRDRDGDAQRRIPEGGLFGLVSCPHYFFEITSWIGFFLLAPVWGSLVFATLGAGILSSYAWTRHKNYRVEFDGAEGRASYPSHRRALVPFLF